MIKRIWLPLLVVLFFLALFSTRLVFAQSYITFQIGNDTYYVIKRVPFAGKPAICIGNNGPGVMKVMSCDSSGPCKYSSWEFQFGTETEIELTSDPPSFPEEDAFVFFDQGYKGVVNCMVGTPPTPTPGATPGTPTVTPKPSAVKWTHGIATQVTTPRVVGMVGGFIDIPAVAGSILGVIAIAMVVLVLRGLQRIGSED